MQLIMKNHTFTLWPLMLLVLAAVLIAQWRITHSAPRVIFSAIFGLYLLVLIDKVFFPLPVMAGPGAWFREPGRWPLLVRSMNLVPFRFSAADPGLRHLMARRVVENVLMTIPFGFGVGFVADIQRRQVWWVAPAVGFALEGIQLALSLLVGGAYRTVDVNDVLLNALGVLIGYGVFLAFGWFVVWAVARRGVEPRGVVG